MSETSQNFVSLIPSWVAATQNVDIPAQPDEEELDRCVVELRGRLKDGTWEDFNLEADDQGLAVLSRLCFELSKPFSVGDSTLCESVVAYELVSRLTWPTDLFGERNEILTRLALVAWRDSRQFGTTETMLVWERKYRAAFSQPSAERDCLEQFLATEASERPNELLDVIFSDVRATFGICELLQDYRDACPAKAATEASFFYDWIAEHGRFTLESERSYFLGTMALLAGSSHRFLGQRESAAKWFDRAHSFFSKLRNAEPELARLAYGRLTLCYELRQYDLVLRDTPLLLARFQKLALEEEEIKCLFLEGMALKESGSAQVALAKFLTLEQRLFGSDPCRLLGGVLSKVGELYSARGRHHEAMQKYQRALPLLRKSGRPSMLADFKGTVGETCRDMGKLATAVDLYREAISDYCELSMGALATYLRIVLAETLLLAGRPREAEIEILAAIPTIEKERMVEEGFAALNLLRESVHQSQTDVASLRALRERMKGDKQ
jgi:tetratricopeptide (TPR) repeat protein